MFKKALTISLATLLLLLSFASCADDAKTETTTEAVADTTAVAVVTEASTVDEDGYKLDSIPEDATFNNETVKILYWSDAERVEFEVTEDEINGSIVEQAIYDRNVRTQERLKVTFEWDSKDGDNGERSAFVSYVMNQKAGGVLYDLIGTYSRTAGMLSLRGVLKDLNSIEDSYLDFDQPWWPSRMTETFTIGNSMYFASGDISTNVLHFMYVIYYNMDMAADLNIEDPVKLVDNHEWTIDKIIELTKGVYSDLDNSGSQTEADRYGFTSIDYGLDAFYTGSGLRLVDSDPDTLLKISDDYTSTKCVDLIDKLGVWCTSNDCYISGGKLGSVKNIVPFAEGNALFCQNRVYIADTHSSSGLHDVEWQYGVLPTPLYDTEQEDYITVEGNPISLWCIMDGLDDSAYSRDSAVMECMASYAYRLTTPALFETNMKYKYTNGADNDGVRMFDIVHNSIDFDLGRIYSDALNYMSEIPTECAANGTSWGATMKGQLKALNAALKNKILKPLSELQ